MVVRRLREADVVLMGFFVGQVMRTAEGKTNPQAANSLLPERLGEK